MPRHVPVYGVFIIESMDDEKEHNNKLNGFVLKEMLDLCDIPNYYIYIRTRLELDYAIEHFQESDFGFLHLSCHGSSEGLHLTLDDISFDELELIMGPYLKYRRLFLSACEAACFTFAEHFIPKHHCYSVMGPANTIDYDKAAIFWSSYYYLMYRDDKERMWQRNIMPALQNITRTFNEKINYFSIINERNSASKRSLREIHFHNGSKIFDQVKVTKFENLYWEEALAEEDVRGEAMPISSNPTNIS